MNPHDFDQLGEAMYLLPRMGRMKAPVTFICDEDLLRSMEEDVAGQLMNVAQLPGVFGSVVAMPDAHFGYGFPIGGVAAFDPKKNGVVSAGGVGFDIACGVRVLHAGLHAEDINSAKADLAALLFSRIPKGTGGGSHFTLSDDEIEAMLAGGASWAVGKGFGRPDDLARVEDNGRLDGADPIAVSHEAKKRFRNELGSLGSGNHYLELQEVVDIFNEKAAAGFGLRPGDVVVSLHCGSRGLGHQVCTDYVQEMIEQGPRFNLKPADSHLACAPIDSELGMDYVGAMRAAMNCALANRQTLTHLVRDVFADILPTADVRVLCDVSHNTCREEEYHVDGRRKRLFVHRKGATKASPPGDPSLPPEHRAVGGPVPVGGSMGAASYILVGLPEGREIAFSSAPHGAGRVMSRALAKKKFKAAKVVEDLAGKGVIIHGASHKGLAEEAPGAYKDIHKVAAAAETAGLAERVAKLRPLISIKG